jgi:hypothetical protein
MGGSMNGSSSYTLPLSWEGKDRETIQNDCRWLESIIRNAAPLSDWWLKARIVQLAYPRPPVPSADPGAYQGLPSEQAIADALQRVCQPAVDYPDCTAAITESYIKETLRSWQTQQFSLAVGRNFEVYASRQYANVYLVTSTAPVSLDVNRRLPPKEHFYPLFNVDELAKRIHASGTQQITVRTHGYSTPADSFYTMLRNEADSLNVPDPKALISILNPEQIYIGYQWPSEQPITSPGLWADYRNHPGVVLKFLVSLGILAGIVGLLLYFPLQLLAPLNVFVSLFLVFFLWLLAFLLLRVVVYQRDRYRTVHYGAPDLAEFFWRLDAALSKPKNCPPGVTAMVMEAYRTSRMNVNLVGHSMGCLMLVNMLRILSDRFGKDQQPAILPDSRENQFDLDAIGDHFLLDSLILASPDIPLEFLREGRNNYVRSAIRRCRRIYLLCSDRDTVLRYLSTVGNWFSEPSIQMSGMRLGNTYLRPLPGRGEPRPFIRIMVHSESAVQPTSSYELFRKFNYLDCSQMRTDDGKGGTNAVSLRLNAWTAIPIDLINTLFFLFKVNKLDVHGGYFHVNTPAFRIIKYILTSGKQSDDTVKDQIQQLAKPSILFWPSQPWLMASAKPGEGDRATTA